MKIPENILNILESGRIEDNLYFMPQLDRKTYLEVNKCLESIGGKWNKKLKGHLFDSDPRDLLDSLLLTGEVRDIKKELNFFETPIEIAKLMVDYAQILLTHKCLETSAGHGRIAEQMLEKTTHVELVEIDKFNCDKLKQKFPSALIYQTDFLEQSQVNRNNLKYDFYDRIVQNPPFHIKGKPQADIDFVYKAWGMLEKGGRLVSVVSESPFFRENKKSVEFRDFLTRNNADIIKLELETFKESGTMVQTRFIVLEKYER